MFKFIIIFLSIIVNLSAYQGEGYGQDKQEAINSALSDISSQISTTINSTTILNKRATNDDYSRNVQSMVHIELPKLSFQNYHILEQKKDNKSYFVKLEIDSKVLASTHARELKQKIDNISQQLNAYSSKLKKYSILKKAQIKKLSLSLELLHAIDSKYDIDSFTNQIESFENEKNSYIKELSFQTQSNNQQVKEIANAVLSRLGLIGSSTGGIVLKINLDRVEKSKISSQYIGTTTATIKIVENHETVFNKRVNLSSTSLISEHYLLKNILKELEKEIFNILRDI